MIQRYFLALLGLLFSINGIAQISKTPLPCSDDAIMKRQLEGNPNALQELAANELFIRNFIQNLKLEGANDRSHDSSAMYIIPVVLHVFHNGDDGMISLEQAQSGLDVLNADMQGLNADWADVDPAFEDVKAPLDVQFCLASIDPEGNPTTGVNYYDDSLKMLNEGDLFAHAWDNFKYLNIYIPKYTGGEWSLFTAYAYYPSIGRVEANIDGVFYSSIRWGYGEHSDLEDGQEWASVVTHEVGHWLDLRHTFENGCSAPGDFVDDTPPTTGGTIEVEGCFNNDESCGVSTNGENYMDYNHDCKKMFTQGQVDRMTAALHLPARSNLWSEENLNATGCSSSFATIENVADNNMLSIYPNPANDFVFIELTEIPEKITIYNSIGEVIMMETNPTKLYQLNVENYAAGIYFYQVDFDDSSEKGKFIVE
ncbi:MAG: T9SS type A sorting domain-containing protein [Crocinitomix sp.]|nr:T9SS type A sorting domain-containing protein [Crocinitomix sp.]